MSRCAVPGRSEAHRAGGWQALKATAALKPGSKTELDVETLDAIADDVPNTVLPKDQVLSSLP